MVSKLLRNARKELLNWGWKDFVQLYLIIVVVKLMSHFVSYLYNL